MHIVSIKHLYPLAIPIASLMLLVSVSIKAETKPQPSYSHSIHSYNVPNVNVVTQDGHKTKLLAVIGQ